MPTIRKVARGGGRDEGEMGQGRITTHLSALSRERDCIQRCFLSAHHTAQQLQPRVPQNIFRSATGTLPFHVAA